MSFEGFQHPIAATTTAVGCDGRGPRPTRGPDSRGASGPSEATRSEYRGGSVLRLNSGNRRTHDPRQRIPKRKYPLRYRSGYRKLWDSPPILEGFTETTCLPGILKNPHRRILVAWKHRSERTCRQANRRRSTSTTSPACRSGPTRSSGTSRDCSGAVGRSGRYRVTETTEPRPIAFLADPAVSRTTRSVDPHECGTLTLDCIPGSPQ